MGLERLPKLAGLLLFFVLTGTLAVAEPLRVLVPQFIGPEPLSQHVRTTVYFELIKAFRAVDVPDKGAWILYDQQPLAAATHDAVLASARWPSVRADLAVWGRVHRYDDGVVVQLQLTLTPLLKKRQVRPELWTLTVAGAAGPQHITLDLPGQFYEFEPLLLSPAAIVQFNNPQGMPLYSSRYGGQEIGSLAEVIRFYEIYEDSILMTTGGKKGWVRTQPLTGGKSEAIPFAKGLVRLLRGDWAGARQSFSRVLANAAIPQNLRIHSLIYTGLAKEKTGHSGRREFAEAYALNRLDRHAAAYLLMSRAAELAEFQAQNDPASTQRARQALKKSLADTRFLFNQDDLWYRQLQSLVR